MCLLGEHDTKNCKFRFSSSYVLMSSKDAGERIKVAVRVRSLNDREKGYKNSSAKWRVEPQSLSHPSAVAGGEDVKYNFGATSSPEPSFEFREKKVFVLFASTRAVKRCLPAAPDHATDFVS